jgi:hypothetical protein
MCQHFLGRPVVPGFALGWFTGIVCLGHEGAFRMHRAGELAHGGCSIFLRQPEHESGIAASVRSMRPGFTSAPMLIAPVATRRIGTRKLTRMPAAKLNGIIPLLFISFVSTCSLLFTLPSTPVAGMPLKFSMGSFSASQRVASLAAPVVLALAGIFIS